MEIRLAARADGQAIKELAKEVFRDDPLMRFFLRQDRRREAALDSFYEFMVVDYSLPCGLCWVTADVSGAALWMPPGRWEPPPAMQIAMVGVVPRSFGWRDLLLKFGQRQKIDGCHPKRPHYYLSGLMVRADRRGKGTGSALLQPILRRSDREGIGCYLEASLERNVEFYRRHGFAVARRLEIGPGRVPVWTMWREPKKPGD
ncbi:MAG: GNAT family N-acetyltransferase [Anaerolineales bacterium]|nr:GNAT family N-acetyltransferase [Anaerolineales bacterium]